MTAAAPDTVTLNVCPRCGRDNRVTDLRLGARWHYSDGTRCYGKPEAVIYTRGPGLLTERDLVAAAEAAVRSLASDAGTALLHDLATTAVLERFAHRTNPKAPDVH